MDDLSYSNAIVLKCPKDIMLISGKKLLCFLLVQNVYV